MIIKTQAKNRLSEKNFSLIGYQEFIHQKKLPGFSVRQAKKKEMFCQTGYTSKFKLTCRIKINLNIMSFLMTLSAGSDKAEAWLIILIPS